MKAAGVSERVLAVLVENGGWMRPRDLAGDDATPEECKAVTSILHRLKHKHQVECRPVSGMRNATEWRAIPEAEPEAEEAIEEDVRRETPKVIAAVMAERLRKLKWTGPSGDFIEDRTTCEHCRWMDLVKMFGEVRE